MIPAFDLRPGAVNVAHDPRFWSVEALGQSRVNPAIMASIRVVLPIRGGGNPVSTAYRHPADSWRWHLFPEPGVE